MRFTFASLAFIASGFLFFIIWAVMSLFLDEIHSAFTGYSGGLDAGFGNILDLLPTAFGVISAIFFVTGIVLIFVMDSFADEPELYWRR